VHIYISERKVPWRNFSSMESWKAHEYIYVSLWRNAEWLSNSGPSIWWHGLVLKSTASTCLKRKHVSEQFLPMIINSAHYNSSSIFTINIHSPRKINTPIVSNMSIYIIKSNSWTLIRGSTFTNKLLHNCGLSP